MTENTEWRVTGKQVLLDAVTFAKDAGTYIYELGRQLFFKIKNALKKDETKEPSQQ